MRTSQNAVPAKFAEQSFSEVRRLIFLESPLESVERFFANLFASIMLASVAQHREVTAMFLLAR